MKQSQILCFYQILYSRGLKTFLPEGHISYYTTVRGLDILHNVIVAGYVKFYQIKNVS